MTDRRIIFWFSITCLLIWAKAAAAQVQAAAVLDSTRLETGNPMTLHLQVLGGQPQGVDFSAWDSLVPPENRLSQTDWRAEHGHWKRELTFTVFDSARLELPPLTVRLQDGSVLRTNPLTLEVYPTPVPDNQPADIKDIRREPTIWLDYLPIMLAVGGLLALAVLVWWLAKRRRPKPAPATRIIETPAHELALRKLDALRQKALWQNGNLKAHYSELTFIAREYLEKRYQILALESTTDEILHGLARTDFPAEHQPLLREVLQWADLAKFAKATPPDSYHDTAIGKIRSIVLATQAPAPPLPAAQSPSNGRTVE
ncbi:MAG: hypothetical protein ACK4Q5_08870 [Saprospiraceae bacterium]